MEISAAEWVIDPLRKNVFERKIMLQEIMIKIQNDNAAYVLYLIITKMVLGSIV